MSSTHPVRPAKAGLLAEICEVLALARSYREQYDTPEEWRQREREMAFDATAALLIRHHLRVDATRLHQIIEVAARRGDLDTFARACTDHVLTIFDERTTASAQSSEPQPAQPEERTP